jgi:hypothetical protein
MLVINSISDLSNRYIPPLTLNPMTFWLMKKDGYLEAVLPTSIPAKSYSVQIVTTSPAVVSNIYSEILRLYLVQC